MEYYLALFKTYFKLEANFIITSAEMLSHIVLMVAEQTSNNLLFCTKTQNCGAPYAIRYLNLIMKELSNSLKACLILSQNN